MAALVPAGFVTLTSTVPTARAGAVATKWVTPLSSALLNCAAVSPNLTAVTPARPVPVMVTRVPPVVVPVLVDSARAEGATTRGAVAARPLTVYAAMTALFRNAHDRWASPRLPQLVPHWLRIQTPCASYAKIVTMWPPRLVPDSVL